MLCKRASAVLRSQMVDRKVGKYISALCLTWYVANQDSSAFCQSATSVTMAQVGQGEPEVCKYQGISSASLCGVSLCYCCCL